MEKPLVSIITPTYNHEKFIKYCFKSVLRQTYTNWEMIVVDDASSDKTPEIIRLYAKKDKRIKFILHKINYGIYRLSESYNEALSISQGKFIAILEGDDFWPHDKLEKQLPLFEEDKVVLTWGRGAYVDEEGKFIRFIIPTASVMIQKHTILSIGGFKQPSNVSYIDYPTWLEFSLKGEFRFSNYILGYWRKHSSQVTNLLFAEQLVSHAKSSMIFFKNLSKYQANFYYNENIIMARNYWLIGRSKLINKESNKARQYFWKVILKGSYILKFKAIIGILASFFHINLEKIQKLLKYR